MYIDLNVLLQRVAIQIQHEVVDEVKTIAHDYQRQLVRQLRLLEEVLDALRVVAVRLATDALDFFDLARLAGGLENKIKL